jgi:putative restriction endonuclease
MIRLDIFRWLDEKLLTGQYEFTRAELEGYRYQGELIPLLDTARGIRNPRKFNSTLTLMTSYQSPYEDLVRDDGFVHYSYQAKDGGDNTKVSRARENGDPIVYFHGLRAGVFTAHFPVYVVAQNDDERMFYLALDESLRFFADPLHLDDDQRRYAERTVRQRLHQPMFRAKVLHAYTSTCAVCQLKHSDLLDAAHILEDKAELGFPVVSNGLALCKLHHAAFDRNLLGITPDYTVQVDKDLLREVDGPMLRHGLQDMHGRRITIPSRTRDHPSRDALALRFDKFAH